MCRGVPFAANDRSYGVVTSVIHTESGLGLNLGDIAAW